MTGGISPPSFVAGTRLLAEREHVGLRASRLEDDLERAVFDLAPLADELVEPGSDHGSVSTLIDVQSACVARRLPVEQHAERHGSPFPRSQDEIHVTAAEAERDR